MDFSSGNERDEARAHFPLSESKNENLENEKSLIEIRFAFGCGGILVKFLAYGTKYESTFYLLNKNKTICKTDLDDSETRFFGLLQFLLTKIIDSCTHLSLGARYLMSLK